MVSSVGHRVIFWASGCIFLIFFLKNRNTKTGLEKAYLFIVNDCLYRYFASMLVYLNLITYITMSIIGNRLQYINSYFRLKIGS